MTTHRNYADEFRDNRKAALLRRDMRKRFELNAYYRMPLPNVFEPDNLTIAEISQYLKDKASHRRQQSKSLLTEIRRLSPQLYATQSRREYDVVNIKLTILINQYIDEDYRMQIYNYLDETFSTIDYYAVKDGGIYGPYINSSTVQKTIDGRTKPNESKRCN